ncbi:hypothetical protein CN925_19560 [Bacillus sp. AFS055030]|nr:hypothetical protein CN925_19560 [Bacillus sp. AFS055030]
MFFLYLKIDQKNNFLIKYKGKKSFLKELYNIYIYILIKINCPTGEPLGKDREIIGIKFLIHYRFIQFLMVKNRIKSCIVWKKW